MAERLSLITVPVSRWAAWSLLRGGGWAELREHYPQAWGLAIEPNDEDVGALREQIRRPAPGAGFLKRLSQRWRDPRVCVQVGAPAEQVQLVWANLMVDDLQGDPASVAAQLKAWHDALAVGGFVMFTAFGPDTARELRPRGERTLFTDMHDWGDRLVSTGFADPVMDMELLTLTYADEASLERDLGELGWAGRFAADPSALGTADRDEERLSLTIEVVYGHAFKVAPKIKVTGETRFSVDDLRVALASEAGRNPRSYGE